MEAFISRMTEAGPAAKRPPHIELDILELEISPRSVIALLLLTGVLSACDRQSSPQGQANAAAGNSTAMAPADGAKNATGAGDHTFSFTIDRSKAGTAAPDFTFIGPDGSDASLKDFAGRPMLVNLWATWCAPCVAEMPTLDAVAEAYAGQGLQVLTVSQDTQGEKQVGPFFAKRGFKHLKSWLDPENQFGFAYGTGVLPTSVLYGADGKEVARVVGAMDWQGKEAKALIAEALKAG
jgi:thiol-disulfide isomerase/thioredoxin